MAENAVPQKSGSWLKNSLIAKLLIIALLVLLLLIPMVLIRSLIDERSSRHSDTIEEIGSKWGGSQTLTGPILILPYKAVYKEGTNRPYEVTEYAFVLPEELNISGKLDPEVRYRSIYKSIVYTADLDLTGNFRLPDLGLLKIQPDKILWRDASVAFGLSDMRGIMNDLKLEWQGGTYNFAPGLDTRDVIGSGASVALGLQPGVREYEFGIRLKTKGSERIRFMPVGKTTTVAMDSTWANPGFEGAFLPEKRSITPKGFHAEWKIFQLNRNYPQQWKGGAYSLNGSDFGVDLVMPVDVYQKTTRSVKYSILFIALTFLAFFFIEVLGKKQMNAMQYVLVGLAMMLFYSLLLSLSEYIHFALAYLIAGLVIVSMIFIYSRSILSSLKLAGFVAGILVVFYAFIFIIIQLQDYALLVGNAGLVVILGVVMYFSRKIDWSGLQNQPGRDLPQKK